MVKIGISGALLALLYNLMHILRDMAPNGGQAMALTYPNFRAEEKNGLFLRVRVADKQAGQ